MKKFKYPPVKCCEKCKSPLLFDKEDGNLGGRYVCPIHGIYWQKDPKPEKQK